MARCHHKNNNAGARLCDLPLDAAANGHVRLDPVIAQADIGAIRTDVSF